MNTQRDIYTGTGLSKEEVADRISRGLVNTNTDPKTKSIAQILAQHTFTLFNAVNLVLALLVITTGELRNMLFLGVVFSNIFIGVIQEIRAKLQVDKLTILTTKRVCVVRDGKDCELDLEDIVVDDVIKLQHGDQVPADGRVLAGDAHLNESLLTGESNPIPKSRGDEILSGSFVDSGSLVYQVTKVGAEGYAARINVEAKYVKAVQSEIISSLKFIIKIATYALVPLGIGLFLRIYLTHGGGYHDAVLQSVAAVVGMIPQGLVLLTSSVFAIAMTRLASKRVLVQQTYCVETLARVDTLCLDKTGTITTGSMEVASLCDVRGVTLKYQATPCEDRSATREDQGTRTSQAATCTIQQTVGIVALSIAAANASDANETARAILEYGAQSGLTALPAQRAVSFSSRRKYSGVQLEDGRCFVMGASQFVLGDDYKAYESVVTSFPSTARVLVCAAVDGFASDDALVGRPRPLGFISIRDQIRPTAQATMAYFLKQGVDLFVISGDDPRTASAIALQVGVKGAEHYVDASQLSTDEDRANAVRTARVFGRVTPERKRELIRCLRNQGHTVAMCGDGVNDVLALKEADCSVAMAQGSAAARNVADIVLADSDFSHMPEVVAEGRRSINNLERSATLFLTKTVYSAVLALIAILLPPYPFIPIQMSTISAAIIGVPSFVLALEPNHERIQGSFLANVLTRSLPASIAIVVQISITMIVSRIFNIPSEEMSSLCMFQMSAVGVALIYRISRPLNPLRILVMVFSLCYVGFFCTFLGSFIRVDIPTINSVIACVILSLAGVVLFNIVYDIFQKKLVPSGRFTKLDRKVGHIHGNHD